MAKTLTGKIPRDKIGVLQSPRLPAELMAAYRALDLNWCQSRFSGKIDSDTI